MRVFVLLFNARTENEGIHTISISDRNVVLMFAEEDDATRYALLLEAQDFPEPAVEALDQDEVKDFCSGAGYECKLIPQGFVPQDEFDRILLSPPEANLENTDWKSEGSTEVEDADTPDPEIERMRRKLEGLL